MSVTVLAPTPALPRVRRLSIWGKIFGNFRMGKSQDAEMPPLPTPTGTPAKKARLASVSTGVDTAKVSYKRNASIAMAKETRSASPPVPQSPSPSKSRAASIASTKSRRMSRSSRRSSWWRSANPEPEEVVPAVPVIDRKYSIFGSHNPDEEVLEDMPLPSPTANRRASYVPRNAASSFLKTTTPLSSDEKAEVIRRASTVDTQGVSNVPAAVNKRVSMIDMRSASNASLKVNKRLSMIDMRAASDATLNVTRSPLKAHKPTPLNFDNDSTASHGMFSMAGVCEIEETNEDVLSPRSGAFSVPSAPRSPTDTIMEADVEVIDSAKPSPELLPVKTSAQIAVVELVA